MTEMEKQLFDKAVEDYSDMVTGLCLVRLGNRQDAEDCYQNVFLKLYRNMAMLLKEPEHLKAWLITVTVNECKNACRFRIRHKTEPLEAVSSFYEDEHDRQLMEQIMKMPSIYREAIYLHYYMGSASAEVRARRRTDELLAKGQKAEFNQILKEIRQRDYQDTHREIAPLKMARDSVKVDTSELDIDEVVAAIRQIAGKKIPL